MHSGGVCSYTRGWSLVILCLLAFSAAVAQETSGAIIGTRFQADLFNTFNQGTVLNRNVAQIHSADARLQFPRQADVFTGFDYRALMVAQRKRVNPLFGLANTWQSERFVRMGVHFVF